jgi:hypothetical protein
MAFDENEYYRLLEESGGGRQLTQEEWDNLSPKTQALLRSQGHTPLPGTSTFDLSGGSIDIDAIFAGLKGEIDALIDQQIQAGRADISLGSARAQDLARESFAGSGLGRSGLAAGTFSGIAQAREGKLEGLTQGLRAKGAAAQLAVSDKAAALEFAEQLRERGENEEDIRSALNFQRQMALRRFQSSLEIAANEPTFWEEWGPIFEIVGNIGAAYVGAG